MVVRWVSLDQKGLLRPHEVIRVVKKIFYGLPYVQFLHFFINFGAIIVYQINGPLKNVILRKTPFHLIRISHLSCGWRSESGLLLTVRNAKRGFPQSSKRDSRHVNSRVNGTSTTIYIPFLASVSRKTTQFLQPYHFAN